MTESCAKRIKNDSHDLKNILTDFEFVKILNEDSMTKSIFIQAKKKMSPDEKTENKENGSSDNAVIIFNKSHFTLDETKSFLDANISSEIHIDNDVYKKLSIFPTKPFNSVQVQLIYPATDAHIEKYSSQEIFFVEETYQDWLDICSKVIENNSAFSLKWVYNILEHKTETERIVFEDTDPINGFILLPDMKWDEKNTENLYLLAIIHQKNILSLRDLNKSHIELLENIRDKSLSAIENKYNVKRSKLRCYLHYHPTFYHLHVHFSHINYHPPGMPEKNYQLSKVIENLKIDTDYFKKVQMEIVVKKNDKLYEIFRDRLEKQA